MNRPKTIVITGASGFLGRHLADYFARSGESVRGLVRNPRLYPFKEAGIRLFEGDLPERIDPGAFEGADVVIHAAYATQAVRPGEAHRVNHLGTLKVREMARAAGAGRFIFISSLAAHPGAESYYGRSKFLLEREMDPARDLIVRPGLVVGPGEAGLFSRMKKALLGLGIVPVFRGGRQILQTIHVDDLCEGIQRAIRMDLTGTLVLADPDGVEIRKFFKLMAQRMNKKCIIVPLPLGLTLWMVLRLEGMGLTLPVTSESLKGLQRMIRMPSAPDLERIGLRLRSVEESLKSAC